MTTFHASKGYHFSEDGTAAKTWAHFKPIPDETPREQGEPPVYAYETDDPKDVAKLRALIKDGKHCTDIVEIDDKPSDSAGKRAPAATGRKTAAEKAAAAAAEKAAAAERAAAAKRADAGDGDPAATGGQGAGGDGDPDADGQGAGGDPNGH